MEEIKALLPKVEDKVTYDDILYDEYKKLQHRERVGGSYAELLRDNGVVIIRRTVGEIHKNFSFQVEQECVELDKDFFREYEEKVHRDVKIYSVDRKKLYEMVDKTNRYLEESAYPGLVYDAVGEINGKVTKLVTVPKNILPTPDKYGRISLYSSFHCQVVQDTRRHIEQNVERVFKEYMNDTEYQYCQQLYDQVSTLAAPVSDNAYFSIEYDDTVEKMFGGWINMGRGPQVFRYLPKSHRGDRGAVFNTPPGIDEKVMLLGDGNRAFAESHCKEIVVEPGAIILYDSRLIKLVFGEKDTDWRNDRLLIAFRISKEGDDYYKGLTTDNVPMLPWRNHFPVNEASANVLSIYNMGLKSQGIEYDYSDVMEVKEIGNIDRVQESPGSTFEYLFIN